MPFFSPSRSMLAVLVLLVALSTSQALQLGETETQILAKHGAPAVADHGRHLAMYYWPGWSARLDFHAGKVAKLTYKKIEYLGAADFESLLQANGGVKRWRETTPPGAKTRQWSREDGAVASCDAARATIMTFQIGEAAVVSLQQLAAADPKAAADPAGHPASEPPLPEFFPDPQAAQPKTNSKLSEISIPTEPGKPLPAEAPASLPSLFPSPTAVQSPPPLAGERSEAPPKPSSTPVAASIPVQRPVPKEASKPLPAEPPEAAPPTQKAKLVRVEPPAPKPVPDQPAVIKAPSDRNPVRPPAPIEPPHPIDSAHPIDPPAAQTTGMEAPATSSGEEMGLGRALALGCMIFGITGALILLYKSLPRRSSPASSLRKSAANPSTGGGLPALRWDQVELLVAEIHRRIGCNVELSAGLGAEDGLDLTLRKNNETVLVQCKHWKTLRVGEAEVREFYGVMAAGGAPKGIIVTVGVFTREAREFADGKGIDLIDRRTLEERMEAVAHPGENLCLIPGWLEEFVTNSRIFDPECPVCRESMTLRQNPTDRSAIWGCRNFPRCSGKREPRRDILELEAARRVRTAQAA